MMIREGWPVEKKHAFGLSTANLKHIAIVSMTVDHIGAYMFPNLLILRILGRLAAPIFLFCMAEGLRHTRNRKKYLLRLYLAGAAISVCDRLLTFFGAPFPQFGNILFTFFYTGLYVTLLEGLFQKKPWALPGLLATAIPTVLVNLYDMFFSPGLSRNLLTALLPSPIHVQYSLLFVLLGMGLYFAKTKQMQLLVYAVFCALCILGTQLGLGNVPQPISYLLSNSIFNSTQQYMLLALPLLALYNGEKGKSSKQFFYAYYPLHRYAICLLAAVLQ